MVKPALTFIYCCVGLILTPISYADEPAPSIALLEYLADLEEINGERIDPLVMKELANNLIDEPTKEKGNE